MDARARIKEIIELKQLSVREVSLGAGLSDSMLHKYLTGQTQSITVDNLEKVAKALGVSFRHLMFGDVQHEKVAYIWDRIAERDQQRALRLLESFTDEASDSAG